MSILGDIWEGVTGALGNVSNEQIVQAGVIIHDAIQGGPQARSLPPVIYNYGGAQVDPRTGAPGGLIQGPMPQPESRWQTVLDRGLDLLLPEPVEEALELGRGVVDLYNQGRDEFMNWYGGGGSQVANGNGGALTIPHAQHPPLFRARRQTAVGQRVIPVMNPMTGKTHFFGDLGTPLLFSRDFSAHKRVNRLARKARRVSGTRSRKRR